MGAFLNDDFCVGYKVQTAFGTPAVEGAKASWEWIRVTFPQDSGADEQEELQVSSGVIGAGDSIVPGRRHGELSFSWDLTSQVSGGGFTTAPAVTEITDLIKALFGNSITGAYNGGAGSGDVLASGSDANTWATTAGSYPPGQCYGAQSTSTSEVLALNWIESQSSTTLTLFEDSRESTLYTTNHGIPFVNIYPSNNQPFDGTGATFRICGNDAAEDMRYTNAFPTSLKLSLNAAKGIQATMTVKYYGRHLAADGGLHTVPEDRACPPLMGQHNARVMIASNAIAAFDNGTEVVEGLCGLDELEVDFLTEQEMDPCHGATDGVSGAQLSNKVAKVACFVPFDATNLTATETEKSSNPDYNNLRTVLEGFYENRTSISFTCAVGTEPGRLFGIRVPRAYVESRPQVATVGKRVGYRLNLRSAPYTGDGSSDDAGNSPYVMCFG